MATECAVCGVMGCDDLQCAALVGLRNEEADADESALTAWWWQRQRAGRSGEPWDDSDGGPNEPPKPKWLRELEVNAAILQARLDEKERNDAA